jgi:hypothetical protein
VEDEIDYSKHTESELVDMFGRMDPRYAPAECARLGKFLAERGFIVTDGGTGPGTSVPSPAMLQSLTGSSRPSEWAVEFATGRYQAAVDPAATFVDVRFQEGKIARTRCHSLSAKRTLTGSDAELQ